MNLVYLESFLVEYSEFRMQPIVGNEIILKGRFQRQLQHKEFGLVDVDYLLSICIPFDYPESLPVVYEIENKIQQTSSNHINPDGSFCLGSPIRLKLALKNTSEFKAFFEVCILPYLYAVTVNQKHGKGFLFGELEHGNEGLISDFQDLFHLQNKTQVYQMLEILSARKKAANKMNCPCACGKRVTECKYFDDVVRMRKLFTRSEWEEQYKIVGGM